MTDLSEADYFSLKEIHQLANEVHDHIQDKNLKKTAKKFVESVQGLLEKMPEYLEDQKKQVKYLFLGLLAPKISYENGILSIFVIYFIKG